MNIKETKKNIIQAGHKAVEELIKVAKEAIVDSDDDISADRLKNAAATKKLAIFDAFEILNRIQAEEDILNEKPKEDTKEKTYKGFAERRAK
jgi:ASC-1-like (ASCH) protein